MSEQEQATEREYEFPWEGRILSIRNLGYEVKPSDVRDFFAPRGKILRVDLERKKTGGTNGLGFVEFASAADCESATELQGTQFFGRTMKCEVATMPPSELVRFYIRAPENRPISDRIRRKIIEEAKRVKAIAEGKRRRRYKRRKAEIESDGEEYEYAYSEYDE